MQLEKGGVLMAVKRPFYESRKMHYDCHVWKHPNYPKHLHKHLEFAYVADGTMKVLINHETRTLSAGDCVLIYPNQIHAYASTGEVELMLIIADMDYMDDFFDELNYQELESPFFQKSQLSQYGNYILDLLHVSAYEQNIPSATQKGMLTVLLSDIFHTQPMRHKMTHTELNLTEKILLYINENIRFPLSAKTLAKDLGISTYYLSHLFARELKMSFPSYVAHQRLNLACDLLRDTNRSVTDIAYDVGFTSMRTFLRCFKTQYNCTPTEWRQIYEKPSIQPLSAKL